MKTQTENGIINPMCNAWMIDQVEEIFQKLYHVDYEDELNYLNMKYINEEVLEEDFLVDMKRVKEIRKDCEIKSGYFYL